MIAPLALVCLFVVAEEWEVPPDQPLVMHAAALDRELDGAIDAALELLRAAQQLAPAEPIIAFDLARVALENDSPRFDADVAPFLALVPESDDARLLRAYILTRQGLRQAAREQLASFSGSFADPTELLRLRDLVAGEGAAAPARLVAGSLRVGLEGDSNVTVVPDSPQREEGIRLAMQGQLAVVPLRAPTELTLQAVLRYGPHLGNREVLSTFDVASATALVRARRGLGATRLTAQLSGNEVVIDTFAQQFMRDLFGDLELRWSAGALELGLFGRGGYRDFSAFNLERDPDDRDGARYSAGALVDGSAGRWGFGAQASFEAAHTDGRRQRELGAELGLYGRWSTWPWQLRLTVNHALRVFGQSRDDGTMRVDNRLTSSLGCSRMVHQRLGVFAAVTWVRNFSTLALDYDRVLGQLGVVSQW